MTMEPIRVLHIVPNMQSGGLETLIMNIYRNIDRTKVQFDFLVHYQGDFFYDDEIRKLGGKIYKLSLRDDSNLFKYIHDLNAFFSNHPEYKIVHGHMESMGQFYFKAALKHGVPVRIAHAHNTSTDTNLKGMVKGILLKGFKTYATDFFACSEMAGKYMFENKKFTVIKNAIPVDDFAYQPEIRQEVRRELKVENNLVIGHVGRFTPQKNHDFILRIFKEIHNIDKSAVLLLCGGGELEQQIKSHVYEMGLDGNVKFLGIRKDVNRLYQAMDCFLFPSLYEGLGIVAIEAQCTGVPVIGSDVIPQEAAVTKNFHNLSLNASPTEWAKEAIRAANEIKGLRKSEVECARSAGYDIKNVSTNLQRFYLSKVI